MTRAGASLREDDAREVKKRDIENSQGSLKVWADGGGVLRLHSTSQLRALSKKELTSDLLRWPLEIDGTECSNAEKLLVLGCHGVWQHRLLWPADEVADAAWRSTPQTAWCVIIKEILDRRTEWFERGLQTTADVLTTEAPHVVAGSRGREYHDREEFVEDEEASVSENWWFLQEFDSRVGGRNQVDLALQKVHHHVKGIEKIEALLCGLSDGTQTAYRRSWRHWILFCTGTGVEPWLDYTKRGWGEIALDFIMNENRVFGLQSKSIRSKISGIRYFHIMAGYGDFSPLGVRYKQLLNALNKGVAVARKFPFGPEMFIWLRGRMLHTNLTHDIIDVWTALVIGFNFLLRGSEVMNLRRQDFSIPREEDGDYLWICVRRSNTDRNGVGVFRSLFANRGIMCPVRAWMSFCALNANQISNGFVFRNVVLHRMRSFTKMDCNRVGSGVKVLCCALAAGRWCINTVCEQRES